MSHCVYIYFFKRKVRVHLICFIFYSNCEESLKHVSNVMKQRLDGAFSDLFFKHKPLQTL